MRRAFLAILLILGAVGVLEMARKDVVIARDMVGRTPVTSYQSIGADGPAVLIAHGFAGSEQMMQAYALPLAQAGYRVFAFDMLGHGRHRDPMSGDVTRIDGTTQLLMNQTREVLDSIAGDGSVGLLGHSMATDVLVRTAQGRDDIGPMVLLSAFSQAIDATHPADLLLIAGAWEPGLRRFALKAEAMTSDRRASVAPFSDHVSILHSRVARRDALDWIDTGFNRTSSVAILPTGWALLALMAGLVIGFGQLVRRVSPPRAPPLPPTTKQSTTAILAPALIAPLIAVPLNPNILPVLVADYLGLHLLIYGTLQLLILRHFGRTFRHASWMGLVMLLMGSAAIGFAIDRYAANFWPTPERLWIIAVLLIGTLPFMLADAILCAGRSLLGRIAIRAGLFISLAIAIALDTEGLFFLAMITPVLILFFVIFGTMGRAVSNRFGPMAAGLGLGLTLAWALGLSFPLFQA